MVESCTVSEEHAVSATTLKVEAADYFETVELSNQTTGVSNCIKPQYEHVSLLLLFICLFNDAARTYTFERQKY